MGKFDGKVAFITGAARGQGRAHAIKFASEGANIIAVDICAPVKSAPYKMGTKDEFDETTDLVEKAGGKILSRVADVRDLEALTAVVDEGVEQFGRLDFILANAGVCTYGKLAEMTEAQWNEMMDIDLSGVWKTVRAGVQHMINAGNGGSIVLTSSTAGLRNLNEIGHYVAAKHGVTGLAKALANELAPHNIRVNSIHPSNCRTPMMTNSGVIKMFRPDLESPTLDDAMDSFGTIHLLDTPWVLPEDVSNTIAYLCSEEARFTTGAAIPVDAGMLAK
ncbi:mycofactocin-coupled SDR family oxidoreductase [Gordonia terrae]|uniref:NAD(P)-dependent oxidoreductase n=2 Tax=Gordonia terrae TaxID=2055 RepID=A0AAD0K5Z1_9ACTN|nr:mycofactocin-coupled SDR family oxidoreductase [Gordonia terrae]VTR08846.1 2-dehydro-3-deoxy-D-gluconate 5-dehydrogenase KduD [Clostridioides difficile]ANY21590.1 3-ketoacyl-ACP reductase [Gordonia terrae]AWO82318.1 NAD(P)-dependent oxidoreductase [Gordonia terrae]VTS17288.1 Putative short-chain type dehydrogenase/reductase MSMEG_6031 [Gordonia terrae]GAB44616.1 carveol dehydrogenase [Gordonia terrae NBRC 100016]